MKVDEYNDDANTVNFSTDSDLTIEEIKRVYQRVIRDGVKLQGRYHLAGLVASAGFDGYSVSLNNDMVYLHVFFDQDFAFDCESESDREDFVELLHSLDPERTAEQMFH